MRNALISAIEAENKGVEMPEFNVGDTVKVYYRITEGNKERIQPYEGLVIRIRKGGTATFTVRKVVSNIGVERIFPYSSPYIQKLEVVKRGLVRRSKLYYIRALRGKAARIKDASLHEGRGDKAKKKRK